MSKRVEVILKDGWYKSATEQEMRIALMHLQMEVMGSLNNRLHEEYKNARDDCFEVCAEHCGWNKAEVSSE